jgi:hypothetical protein
MTPIKAIHLELINITRKRVATWQTHNIQLANFGLASLRVIWFGSGTFLGCRLTAASHLEEAFSRCKSRVEK